MAYAGSTCWRLVEEAAAGQQASREEFARLYMPVARAYLCARWRATPLTDAVEDTVQDVFVDCFRPGGALAKLDRARGGSFKAFFYGVVRYVALRTERKLARNREKQPDEDLDPEAIRAREKTISAVFDEAWALAVLEQAVERHAETARANGKDAEKRVDLLRLRFREGLPIREIASRWDADPAHLHKEYARARREYRTALLEVVAFHHPGTPREVERECAQLLSLFR